MGGAFWAHRNEPQRLSDGNIQALAQDLRWSPELTGELFANGIRSPIIQGDNGDCYLLSSMRAMLDHPRAQELIKRIGIQKVEGLKGESYRVTLPGKDPVEIPVGLLDEEELIPRGNALAPKKFSTARGPGWVRLMEYVVGTHVKPYRRSTRFFDDLRDAPHARLAYLVEGIPDEALTLLTGGTPTWFSSTTPQPTHTPEPWLGQFPKPGRVNDDAGLKLTFDDTGHQQGAFAFLDTLADEREQWVMCANTPTSQTGMAFSQKHQVGPHKLERNHSYSILAVDKTKRTVEVCDPKNDNVVMIMSYEQFTQAFQSFSGVKLT